MTVRPVENAKELSRQLDRCERDLDRLDREMAEKEERGEVIPEDMRELHAASRERLARIREKIEEIAFMEKLRKRLARAQKDRSVEVSPSGAATVDPASLEHPSQGRSR